jgi:hypothetical protein
MSMTFECARCRQPFAGKRLIIEQNATDDSGFSTLVEKCWTLCPPCAEAIMALVGEASPWQADGRTVILPDTFDEMTTRLFAYAPGQRAGT